jgi:hypothetical protein
MSFLQRPEGTFYRASHCSEIFWHNRTVWGGGSYYTKTILARLNICSELSAQETEGRCCLRVSSHYRERCYINLECTGTIQNTLQQYLRSFVEMENCFPVTRLIFRWLWCTWLHSYCKQVKSKYIYPCNSPWRPIGLWDVEAPTFSRRLFHRWWGQLYAPAAPYTQEGSRYSFQLEAEWIPGP